MPGETLKRVGDERAAPRPALSVVDAAAIIFGILVGALCYAELASAYPHAGGDYHYLARSFGRDIALLFAWARLAVIQTGSIAILAFVFGDYAAQLLPLGARGPSIYA